MLLAPRAPVLLFVDLGCALDLTGLRGAGGLMFLGSRALAVCPVLTLDIIGFLVAILFAASTKRRWSKT